ncbi:hypothetical protein [Microbacterium hydrothermale]|uniref:hypothetical protein n=1 Tax=Microbacterium hydrothermale TaxID=857427 RepID=UPI0010A841D8|nr:hypothetical protein [Microbacterium hydrothermale]
MTQITSTAPAPAPVVTQKASRRISSVLVRQEASLLGVVAVIVIAATVINPAFLTATTSPKSSAVPSSIS